MDKRNNNTIRYVIVKDGAVDVKYADDFISLMKDEYNYFFDSADCLFDRYLDIRVFVKEGSCFNEKPTMYYFDNNELMTSFNGTVFFAKLGKTKVMSLSNKEVNFLLNNIKRRDDGLFVVHNDINHHLY